MQLCFGQTSTFYIDSHMITVSCSPCSFSQQAPMASSLLQFNICLIRAVYWTHFRPAYLVPSSTSLLLSQPVFLTTTTITTTVLRPFFRDHRGEPVPEENVWTLWCKGRLTEVDTPTIQTKQCPPSSSSF